MDISAARILLRFIGLTAAVLGGIVLSGIVLSGIVLSTTVSASVEPEKTSTLTYEEEATVKAATKKAFEVALARAKKRGLQEALKAECGVCKGELKSFEDFGNESKLVKTSCGHLFCDSCLSRWGKDRCPLCRGKMAEPRHFTAGKWRKERLEEVEGFYELPEYLDFVSARAKYHLKAQVLPQLSRAARRDGPVSEWDDLFDFIPIPAGTFNMGSSADPRHEDYYANRFRNEVFIENVSISAHELSRTPVTQLQYVKVENRNPSHFKERWFCPDDYTVVDNIPLCPSYPVESLSYAEALSYTRKLTQASGGRYSYRLPTEAEWEFAAKAGRTGPFPWEGGQANLGLHAWYADNSALRTHPVGKKQANAWGLFDMIGNIWEWTLDAWLEDRSELPKNNPHFVGAANDSRVIRGGSWANDPPLLGPSARLMERPDDRDPYVGFRVVRQ